MSDSDHVKPTDLFNVPEADALATLRTAKMTCRIGMRDGEQQLYDLPLDEQCYMLLSIEEGIVRGAIVCGGF